MAVFGSFLLAVHNQNLSTIVTYVGPEVFDILGISLVLGRNFTEADVSNEISGSVHIRPEIINQVLAERLWPGENPIGKIFYDDLNDPCEVVGGNRSQGVLRAKLLHCQQVNKKL